MSIKFVFYLSFRFSTHSQILSTHPSSTPQVIRNFKNSQVITSPQHIKIWFLFTFTNLINSESAIFKSSTILTSLNFFLCQLTCFIQHPTYVSQFKILNSKTFFNFFLANNLIHHNHQPSKIYFLVTFSIPLNL